MSWRGCSIAVPKIGEDPATGSAAGPLGAYLAHHGLAGMPGTVVVAQGEMVGRPSFLHVDVQPRGDSFSVRVGGGVRIVGEGIVPRSASRDVCAHATLGETTVSLPGVTSTLTESGIVVCGSIDGRARVHRVAGEEQRGGPSAGISWQRTCAASDPVFSTRTWKHAGAPSPLGHGFASIAVTANAGPEPPRPEDDERQDRAQHERPRAAA